MTPSNAGFRSLHLLPILTCYRLWVKRKMPCGAPIFRWITIMKLPVRLALLLPKPCFRLWLCNHFSTLLARPVFNMGILSLHLSKRKRAFFKLFNRIYGQISHFLTFLPVGIGLIYARAISRNLLIFFRSLYSLNHSYSTVKLLIPTVTTHFLHGRRQYPCWQTCAWICYSAGFFLGLLEFDFSFMNSYRIFFWIYDSMTWGPICKTIGHQLAYLRGKILWRTNLLTNHKHKDPHVIRPCLFGESFSFSSVIMGYCLA